MSTRTITIEIDTVKQKIYIGEDNASGSVYDGITAEDVGYAVQTYLEDNE